MRLTKQSFLAIFFGLLLISSEILVAKKHLPSKAAMPDLQRIIKLHPIGWESEKARFIDPNSKSSTYDLEASELFRRADGKVASVVMTWSLDGVQGAGHPQEVCYNAQGFTVSTPRKSSIMVGSQKLDFVSFTGRHGDMIEDVIYWRVIGGKHDAALYENFVLTHRVKEFTRLLLGDIPDNIMVRVSSWRPATDPPSTVHIEYIQAYLLSLPPFARHLLTGL